MSEEQRHKRCRQFAVVLALVGLVVPALVLCGWQSGAAALTSLVPGLPPMKPTTALGFAFISAGILCAAPQRRAPLWAVRLLGFAALALGMCVLAVRLAGSDASFNAFFARLGFISSQIEPPIRMSYAAATSFVFLGASLMLYRLGHRHAAAVRQACAGLVVIIGALGLEGYFFNARGLYAVGFYSIISLYAAALFIMLALAALCIQPGRAWMRLLLADQIGSQLARRVMPLVVLVPFVTGWLRYRGEAAGLYSTPFGIAIFIASNIVVIGALVIVSARWLNKLDTARRAVESELQSHELRLAAIVTAAMDAIVTIDQQCAVALFNAAAERMFGRTSAEMRGAPLSLILPGSGRGASGVPCLGSGAHPLPGLAGNTITSATGRRADGGSFPVEVTASQVAWGGEAYFTLVLRDVTQRQAAEAALHRSEARLQTVIENMTEGLVIADAQGNLVHWNPAAVHLHGFTDPAEWQRSLSDFRQVFELIPLAGPTLPFEQWPLMRIYRGEPVRELILKIRRIDIAWERIFSYNGSLVTGAAGETLAFLSITDVTARVQSEAELKLMTALLEDRVQERTEALRHTQEGLRLLNEELELRVQERTEELQRSQAQLQQAQKMEAIGQLAGGVAHDFNNMLTVINGYSETMLHRLPPADPNREGLAEILSAGKRAATLTKQLLAFSRKQVLELRVLSLNDVIVDVERMLRRLIGEHINLNTALAEDLKPVKIDKSQVQQVILNLAVNARDAMPLGGSLTIETHNIYLDENYTATHLEAAPGEHVVLSITDTGTGMTPEIRNHIFEPFFTTKGVGKGTGLGLATVFGILKQIGGSIEVYSEIDMGSCFKIYLPVYHEEAPQAQAPLHTPARRGTETILLVEDDAAVRHIARLALENYGYKVIEAPNGLEGVVFGEDYPGPIHLLLSDVVMPEMSGEKTAELLRMTRPSMRVLFMSGYIDDAVVRHGIIDSQAAFIHKPFSQDELARKVREVLDTP